MTKTLIRTGRWECFLTFAGSIYVKRALFFLPPIIGLLFFIFRDMITATWPFPGNEWPGWDGTIIWPVLIYWALYPLTPILLFLQDWAKIRNDKLAQSLPDSTFVSEFGRIACAFEDKLVEVPRTAKSPRGIPIVLRMLLEKIASLAYLYDSRPGVRYAANVMYFVSHENIFKREELFYFKVDDSRGELTGGLVLLKRHSALAHGTEGVPDPKIVAPVLFPLINPNQNSDGEWNILPGAPKAFVNAGASLTESMERIMKAQTVDDVAQVTNGMNLTDDECQTFTDYYAGSSEGEVVKSFVSFPLFGQNGIPFAVLNIHCNMVGWLGGNEDRQNHCKSLLMPFINSISNVAELIDFPMPQAARNKGGNT